VGVVGTSFISFWIFMDNALDIYEQIFSLIWLITVIAGGVIGYFKAEDAPVAGTTTGLMLGAMAGMILVVFVPIGAIVLAVCLVIFAIAHVLR
jgi:hypothetical protein